MPLNEEVSKNNKIQARRLTKAEENEEIKNIIYKKIYNIFKKNYINGNLQEIEIYEKLLRVDEKDKLLYENYERDFTKNYSMQKLDTIYYSQLEKVYKIFKNQNERHINNFEDELIERYKLYIKREERIWKSAATNISTLELLGFNASVDKNLEKDVYKLIEKYDIEENEFKQIHKKIVAEMKKEYYKNNNLDEEGFDINMSEEAKEWVKKASEAYRNYKPQQKQVKKFNPINDAISGYISAWIFAGIIILFLFWITYGLK